MGMLDGKVVVVAGGAGGIGSALSTHMAAEGGKIVVGDLDLAQAEAVVARIIKSGGVASACAFDLNDEASVAGLVRHASETYGRIDAMHVNGANMSLCNGDGDVLDTAISLYDQAMQTNVRGYVLCTKAVMPWLVRSGGAILYTTSGAAYAGEDVRYIYAMGKSAINALMRHVARRFGRDGVRANAVSPGAVAHDRLANVVLQSDFLDQMMALQCVKRAARGRDIAAISAFLMSDDGSFISGEVIAVDGGITMRA